MVDVPTRPAVLETDTHTVPCTSPRLSPPAELNTAPTADLDTAADAARRFHIPATEVRALLEQHACSRAALLRSLVDPCSHLARPPISRFRVGAVGMTPDGDVYVGVNLEFQDMPLNNSVHAEQFLIANARLHGERALELVAVNAAPCGHCRQFFSELACADAVRFLFPTPMPTAGLSEPSGDAAHAHLREAAEPSDEAAHAHPLAALLPFRFRPEDLLGDSPPPLLLAPQRLPLNWAPEAAAALRRRAADASFAAAACSALEEARESYAPYSRCPAGVAVITEAGDVFSGAYLESAAFNPSLPALQAALVDAVIHDVPNYTAVREVIVAELVGTAVRHAPATRFLLSFIAPAATVSELPVRWADDAAAAAQGAGAEARGWRERRGSGASAGTGVHETRG